jgi:hypothetical protein
LFHFVPLFIELIGFATEFDGCSPGVDEALEGFDVTGLESFTFEGDFIEPIEDVLFGAFEELFGAEFISVLAMFEGDGIELFFGGVEFFPPAFTGTASEDGAFLEFILFSELGAGMGTEEIIGFDLGPDGGWGMGTRTLLTHEDKISGNTGSV